eukprot:1983554-Karenia_brevis.AAC.1
MPNRMLMMWIRARHLWLEHWSQRAVERASLTNATRRRIRGFGSTLLAEENFAPCINGRGAGGARALVVKTTNFITKLQPLIITKSAETAGQQKRHAAVMTLLRAATLLR